MLKPKAIFVCGPWGGGTSSVAQLLEAMGLEGAPPFLISNDPRTLNTYESMLFRNTLLGLASEPKIRLRTEDQDLIRDKLTAFRTELLNDYPLMRDSDSYYFKYPLACLVLPELSRLFDARFLYVIRPLADIERTRVRRNWEDYYGAKGAGKVYARMFNFYINGTSPVLFVRYNELLENPVATVKSIVEFSNLETDVPIEDLAALVRRR